MELSLNEIETTVVKAARGRGFDHGIAAEVGAAARWLCEQGEDGVGAVTEALSNAECDARRLGLGAVDLALASNGPVPVSECVSGLLLRGLAGRVGLEVRNGPDGSSVGRFDGVVGPARAIVTVTASDCWPQIENWAAQTYVPSSEQSRIAGAGAGLTDND